MTWPTQPFDLEGRTIRFEEALREFCTSPNR